MTSSPATASTSTHAIPAGRGGPFRFGFFGALGALVAFGLVRGISHATSVLVLIVVSVFIAVGLDPLVSRLIRRGLKRPIAVLVVLTGLLVVFVVLGWAVIPTLTEQVTSLVRSIPVWLTQVQKNPTLHKLDLKYHWVAKVTSYVTDGDLAKNALGGLWGIGLKLAGALFSGLTVFVLVVYLLSSLPSTKQTLYRLVPRSRRSRVEDLSEQILTGIGAYLGGQFLVALCSATCLFTFATLIGMGKYALSMAVLVACTTFIPMVGGFLAIGVAALIGLSFGTGSALACLIYGICYQQFENYFVQPRIMRRAVEVPGIVTVLAALLGGSILGFVGALMAIPIAAALMLLTQELWMKKAEQL